MPQVALTMLKHDKDVAAYSGASFNNLEMDGQNVPFLLENDGATVAPPILSGHGVQGAHEVVLGAATMAQLHKRLGQDVTISFGAPADAPLHPADARFGSSARRPFPPSGSPAPSPTTRPWAPGCCSPSRTCPSRSSPPSTPAPTQPSPARTWLSSGSDRVSRRQPRSLASIGSSSAADAAFAAEPGGSAGNAIVVQGVQRPAEIVNYKTIGLTPALLVAGLVLGAVAALTLTLVASVRQRRRDLALLKTIGFVRRQLAAAVAWQATVAAAVGILIGIPLGLIVGRWLWDLFAEQIDAVPYSDRVRPVGRPGRAGHGAVCQPRGGAPGQKCRADAHGPHVAGGMIVWPGSGRLLLGCDRHLEIFQRRIELGRSVPPSRVRGGQLLPGRRLTS